MDFANPWMLFALLLPAAGFWALRRRTSDPSLARWPVMLRVAIVGDRLRSMRGERARPAVLLLIAAALVIVAASRPRWGERNEDLYIHTRQVMIALDLSRSMTADDVAPSRLERAKEVTTQLLDALQGESVGLIVFAGTAFVQVPLSTDYQIIREFLPTLTPDYMPQGGSDYQGMLDAALEGFGDSTDSDRYLFVLSDGESSTEGWEQRIDAVNASQVHVVAMGVGTGEGAFLPDGLGGYLQDQDGNTIRSTLMPASLQALAKRSTGQYLEASTLQDSGDVETLVEQTVETGRKGRQNTEATVVMMERFQWFLLPAILLALVALWREFQQRPQTRDIRQRAAPGHDGESPKAKLAASVALIAVLLLPPDARAHYDNEAEFDVRAEFTSNPTERLRAIARHLGERGYDAFDLRLLVEATIRYGADQQREKLPVSEGAIRDALEASHQGERLDATIANWSYYRSQLAAVLERNADGALGEETNESKKELMDEEDNPPTVTGEGNQSFANDSFGQGTATKTDATLGDLTAPENAPRPKRREKPPLPNKQLRAAAARNSAAGAGPDDAVLKLQQQRLVEIGKNDSPGRVHQLLAEMSGTPPSTSNKFDW